MKKTKSKQMRYLISLIISIFVCESFFLFNNKFIQCLGMLILPLIVMYSVLLFKSEKNKKLEKFINLLVKHKLFTYNNSVRTF